MENPLDSVFNEDGSINYEQVVNTAAEILSGVSRIDRLNERGERGRNRGGGLLVGSSLVIGREAGTSTESDSRKRRNREEELLNDIIIR